MQIIEKLRSNYIIFLYVHCAYYILTINIFLNNFPKKIISQLMFIFNYHNIKLCILKF